MGFSLLFNHLMVCFMRSNQFFASGSVMVSISGYLSALLWVGVCISLSACGTKVAEQPASLQERITFSQNVLVQAYTVQKYMSLCRSMSEATMAETQTLEKQWLIDYWARVSLADSEYRSHINELKSTLGEKVAVIKPISLALNVDREEQRIINRINNHYNNRDGRCLRVLKDRIAESAAVINAAENNRVIAALTPEHTKAVRPYRVLLDYQAGLSPSHIAKGRSLFKAENMAFQYCGDIAKTQVIVLDQSGSAEYYGVNCSNDKLAVIRCQFGQCEQSSSKTN